jgi:uncharacterized protein (TIGR00730 family)
MQFKPQELDMPSNDSSLPRPEISQPPPEVVKKINELMALMGASPETIQGDLIGQIIYTSLKMANEGFDIGQLKLMTRSFKEMRYAYRIFNEHRVEKCVSIFGSARTSPDHPDYQAAKAFSSAMSAKGWVCMTGAADGIMRAGLEGAKKGASFGLSIRLPFENASHSLLQGDPKLISFRYFFTRKLMFLSHSDAVAAFPGGVGTQDELFEVLTLMQTGRSNIIPLVLLEGGHDYWHSWEHYLQNNLLAKGFMSAEDQNFYYRAPSVEAAVDHIQQFYRRYHSSRYVKDVLVIRLLSPLTPRQIASLNEEFSLLISRGDIYSAAPLSEEDDHLDLPRIAFEHNHNYFGLLRGMIDRINSF